MDNTNVIDNTKAQFAEKVQSAGMVLIRLASNILQNEYTETDIDSVTIDLENQTVSFGKVICKRFDA